MPNPRLILVSLCAGAGICAFGATWMWNQRAASLSDARPELGLRISEFSLTDQSGEPVDATILDGTYTVVGFIFTNCPGLCPIMTKTMAEAQDRLRGSPVRLLSLSLDADRDTPEAMKAFGEAHGASFANWTFATGDSGQTRRIVAEDLKLVVDDEAENQVPTADGGTMANILHPTRMILVGPDRSVLGFYSVMDASGLDALESDVRSLVGR